MTEIDRDDNERATEQERRGTAGRIGLAMAAVESTGSQAPLGSHAAQIYAQFNEEHADKDFSAVIEMLRR